MSNEDKKTRWDYLGRELSKLSSPIQKEAEREKIGSDEASRYEELIEQCLKNPSEENLLKAIDLCYNGDKRVLKYAKEKPKEFIFSLVAAAYGQKAFNESRFEEAANKFMDGIEQFPQNLMCITGFIDALTRCQKFTDKTAEICYQLYEMSLTYYPDEYKIGCWLAYRLIEKQQFELAYKVIEKAITIHRNVKSEDLNMQADMLCLKAAAILSNPKMDDPQNYDWVRVKVSEAEIALNEALKLNPDLLLSEEVRKAYEGIKFFLNQERRW